MIEPMSLQEKVDATLQDWQAHGCRERKRYTDTILALIASELVKVQREAFVVGWEDAWLSHPPDDADIGYAESEAARRYPEAPHA